MTRGKLIIVGAGGFGREALQWASDAGFEVSGFLDSNPWAFRDFRQTPEILGDPATWVPSPETSYICAIGDSAIRCAISTHLREKGAVFAKLVHPSAIISPDCEMGEGCIVGPRAVITVNTFLGRDTVVNIGCCISHDVRIADGVTLSPNCTLCGGVVIESGAFLGASATVIPRFTIGEGAVVGAGSLVRQDVPPRVTVVGVPARIVSAPPVVNTFENPTCNESCSRYPTWVTPRNATFMKRSHQTGFPR
jgi:sugar O-acyltransferase (sialic acid O-acetyltransferase NeuD family)